MEKSFFSSRTSWSVHSNEISSIAELLRKKEVPLINLTETNPTQCDFAFYKNIDFSSAFLNEVNSQYNPSAKGNPNTRIRIAAYYRTRDIKLTSENIFLTASTSESYSHIFRLLCNPNDEIVVPSPSYPLLEYICAMNDVIMKHYNLHYDGEWALDFASLKKNLNVNTKAIIIINPNNPTGSFLREEEWRRLQEISEEFSCAIILDEVFSDYPLNNCTQFELIPDEEILLFRLNGISKMLALPQWKLGWLSVEGNNELVQNSVKKLEIICDTFLSVNTAIQHAFPSLMNCSNVIQKEISERIHCNYKILLNEFQHTSVTVLKTNGGWCAILHLPNIFSDEQWAKKILLEENIFVHPGYFYDFDGGSFIVLSLITRHDEFLQGIQRIKNNVEKTL
ncbi:MAG: pyridoxal phosphate-dependent aminotransferase [Bacteroidota bacterium]